MSMIEKVFVQIDLFVIAVIGLTVPHHVISSVYYIFISTTVDDTWTCKKTDAIDMHALNFDRRRSPLSKHSPSSSSN